MNKGGIELGRLQLLSDRDWRGFRFLAAAPDFFGKGTKRLGNMRNMNVLIWRRSGPNLVFHTKVKRVRVSRKRWAESRSFIKSNTLAIWMQDFMQITSRDQRRIWFA
jgi:hypothetical protein